MAGFEELLEKQTIREKLHLYCRSFDRMDRELAMTIWHPDGTAHYPGQEPVAFLDMFDVSEAGRRRLQRSSHQVTSVLVELREEGKAVSEAYGFARAQEPPVDGRTVEHHWTVRWLDRWSKRGGDWRIDHRQVVVDLYSRETIGHCELPLAPENTPQRDRSDPVYALFAK